MIAVAAHFVPAMWELLINQVHNTASTSLLPVLYPKVCSDHLGHVWLECFFVLWVSFLIFGKNRLCSDIWLLQHAVQPHKHVSRCLELFSQLWCFGSVHFQDLLWGRPPWLRPSSIHGYQEYVIMRIINNNLLHN